MRILTAVTFDDLPFEHELQSVTARLTKAIGTLNGKVLPIEPEVGETVESLRAACFNAARKASINISTSVHEGTIYIWKRRTHERDHATVAV